MRTHSEIIGDSVSAFAERVGADPNNVNQWKRAKDGQGSIPSAYWKAVALADMATLAELAEAAAQLGPIKRARSQDHAA